MLPLHYTVQLWLDNIKLSVLYCTLHYTVQLWSDNIKLSVLYSVLYCTLHYTVQLWLDNIKLSSQESHLISQLTAHSLLGQTLNAQRHSCKNDSDLL